MCIYQEVVSEGFHPMFFDNSFYNKKHLYSIKSSFIILKKAVIIFVFNSGSSTSFATVFVFTCKLVDSFNKIINQI